MTLVYKKPLGMKKNLLVLFIILSGSAAAQSGETENQPGGPDIPGTIMLELGVNRAVDAPSDFDIGFWGSRTFNIYYKYDIRLFRSKFSLVPGVGLSLERYKFINDRIIGYNANDSVKLLTPEQAGLRGVRKAQLITNYVEIPVALQFTANPDDPNRSFKASLGARLGYLYDSFTKVKYREGGEIKKLKDKQNFNLTELRYGVFAKIGAGNFSVFGYYNLSPLFKKDEGLVNPDRSANNFRTFTVGISLAGF